MSTPHRLNSAAPRGDWPIGAVHSPRAPLLNAARLLASAAIESATVQSCLNQLPLQSSVFATELLIDLTGVASAFLEIERPNTVGCQFSIGDRRRLPLPAARTAAPALAGSAAKTRRAHGRGRHSRIRPPRDVVKLADRLRLLLEPPLETLLANERLDFARPPFAFQLDGVAFLYPRREAVLADEMGLGKTMQAITAVRLLIRQGQMRRVLLVCPKPLVPNWQREFAMWAPEICVTAVDGGAARRKWLWEAAPGPVMIANYEALVRDRATVSESIAPFDLVILDEAQRIKNSASATNEAVRTIVRSRSWALTGTPIENSIDDLVGIFEFVAPGQINGEMKPRAISRAIGDHVLRRNKEQVLTELPPKLFRDAEVSLLPEQAESYRLAEDEGVVRLQAMRHLVTIQHVFELVLRLKQICNFDPATGASSKFERLEADLEECAASGRKAIVFSQWVETLKVLASRLSRFQPAWCHGQISQRARESEIERFRDASECHVILMSYGAGSVGLNLQFASYVFLFDRWWNPAVEDQAINRAHRIGAKEPVTVTRFLTAGTIEQRINDVLERKRALFDEIFDDSAAAPGRGLTREEVFALFNLRFDAAAA
jgi:SNF2 family DNA or RNA helicase